MYLLVPSCTTVHDPEEFGFSSCTHDKQCNEVYELMKLVYVLSSTLKSRIPQDRDQLYKTVQEGTFHDVCVMYRFMSVYSSTIL